MLVIVEMVIKVLKLMVMLRFSVDFVGRLMNDVFKVLVYLVILFCDYFEERVLQLLGNEDFCDGDICYFLFDYYVFVLEMVLMINFFVFGSILVCIIVVYYIFFQVINNERVLNFMNEGIWL